MFCGVFLANICHKGEDRDCFGQCDYAGAVLLVESPCEVVRGSGDAARLDGDIAAAAAAAARWLDKSHDPTTVSPQNCHFH